MARSPMSTVDILAILRETPSRLGALTSGATEAQLTAPPEPGEWSALEVLAHLRSCAGVWGDGISTIVANDHPTIRAVNPTTWIRTTDYREIAFSVSLRAFTRRREHLVAVLDGLKTADWSKSATVLGAGAPLEWTAHHYAERLARHERAHLRQVQKTVESVRARGAPFVAVRQV